jgi:hypothetical protein
VKFYLDEDISPRVAEILRKRGIDGVNRNPLGFSFLVFAAFANGGESAEFIPSVR